MDKFEKTLTKLLELLFWKDRKYAYFLLYLSILLGHYSRDISKENEVSVYYHILRIYLEVKFQDIIFKI